MWGLSSWWANSAEHISKQVDRQEVMVSTLQLDNFTSNTSESKALPSITSFPFIH